MLAAMMLARRGALRAAAARAAQALVHAPLPAQQYDGQDLSLLLTAAASCSGQHARSRAAPLPQGFACRGLAASAAAASGAAAAPGAGQKRAPTGGKRGAKDAAGQPLPDPRTVAFLVERGVGDTAAVEALLRRFHAGGSRYPFETAEAAYVWLATVLEGCSKEGVSGVTLVVRKCPLLLRYGVATLQRTWDFLQAPAPAGLGRSSEQACDALMSFPTVLTYSPQHMMQIATTLSELGVADVPAALARNERLLSFTSAMLHTKADVLQQHGLEAGTIISALPTVLNLSTQLLHTKLRWLLHVAGCSAADVQRDPVLLVRSLHGRTRPRFFLVRQLGVGGRCKISSLMQPKDAKFLEERLHGTPAASWSVEQLKKHIASPEFARYMDSEEAALHAKHAAR
jgi:hypothetical protein